MEFTIYSIGDSAYLAQVLNALAMICGTGSFKTLVAIGGVIGLLVMGVQCIMTGTRQFNIHQTLVGMMAYMIMFGPSCTVLIEDAYNGTVRPVANVPIGPAVAGSMISNIGYGITDLFEQAYNDDITLTRKNTVEAMKALGELRSIAADNSIIEAASASLGSDVNLQLSIDNYFRECTMTGITLGTTTASQIYNQGIDGLRFDSNVYGTQVWLPSHVGEFMTCTAAWQPLKTAIDTAFRDPRTIRSVNRLLGIQTANGAVSDNFDELDNVYDMLTGAGQSASNYVKTAVLERLYEQAAAGTYRDLNDLASAVMVSTAIEQRNTQWAAEQSMFLTTMRPLMAFFEAFLYAITPLMAMLMMMGAFGMQLIGKYFQLTVWLQLWFPVGTLQLPDGPRNLLRDQPSQPGVANLGVDGRDAGCGHAPHFAFHPDGLDLRLHDPDGPHVGRRSYQREDRYARYDPARRGARDDGDEDLQRRPWSHHDRCGNHDAEDERGSEHHCGHEQES